MSRIRDELNARAEPLRAALLALDDSALAAIVEAWSLAQDPALCDLDWDDPRTTLQAMRPRQMYEYVSRCVKRKLDIGEVARSVAWFNRVAQLVPAVAQASLTGRPLQPAIGVFAREAPPSRVFPSPVVTPATAAAGPSAAGPASNADVQPPRQAAWVVLAQTALAQVKAKGIELHITEETTEPPTAVTAVTAQTQGVVIVMQPADPRHGSGLLTVIRDIPPHDDLVIGTIITSGNKPTLLATWLLKHLRELPESAAQTRDARAEVIRTLRRDLERVAGAVALLFGVPAVEIATDFPLTAVVRREPVLADAPGLVMEITVAPQLDLQGTITLDLIAEYSDARGDVLISQRQTPWGRIASESSLATYLADVPQLHELGVTLSASELTVRLIERQLPPYQERTLADEATLLQRFLGFPYVIAEGQQVDIEPSNHSARVVLIRAGAANNRLYAFVGSLSDRDVLFTKMIERTVEAPPHEWVQQIQAAVKQLPVPMADSLYRNYQRYFDNHVVTPDSFVRAFSHEASRSASKLTRIAESLHSTAPSTSFPALGVHRRIIGNVHVELCLIPVLGSQPSARPAHAQTLSYFVTISVEVVVDGATAQLYQETVLLSELDLKERDAAICAEVRAVAPGGLELHLSSLFPPPPVPAREHVSLPLLVVSEAWRLDEILGDKAAAANIADRIEPTAALIWPDRVDRLVQRIGSMGKPLAFDRPRPPRATLVADPTSKNDAFYEQCMGRLHVPTIDEFAKTRFGKQTRSNDSTNCAREFLEMGRKQEAGQQAVAFLRKNGGRYPSRIIEIAQQHWYVTDVTLVAIMQLYGLDDFDYDDIGVLLDCGLLLSGERWPLDLNEAATQLYLDPLFRTRVTVEPPALASDKFPPVDPPDLVSSLSQGASLLNVLAVLDAVASVGGIKMSQRGWTVSDRETTKIQRVLNEQGVGGFSNIPQLLYALRLAGLLQLPEGAEKVGPAFRLDEVLEQTSIVALVRSVIRGYPGEGAIAVALTFLRAFASVPAWRYLASVIHEAITQCGYLIGLDEAKAVGDFILKDAVSLGLVEHGKNVDGDICFRVTDLGIAVLLGREVAPTTTLPWTVLDNFEIMAYLAATSAHQLAVLRHAATVVSRDENVVRALLTRESVMRALDDGRSIEQIIESLNRYSRVLLTDTVTTTLRDWARRRESATIYRATTLLEFHDAAARSQAQVQGATGEPIGDRWLRITARPPRGSVNVVGGATDIKQPRSDILHIQADGSITIVGSLDLLTRPILRRLCEVVDRAGTEDQGGEEMWRLTKASISAARSRRDGSIGLLTELRQRANSLSPLLELALQQWGSDAPQLAPQPGVWIEVPLELYEAMRAEVRNMGEVWYISSQNGKYYALLLGDAIEAVQARLRWAGLLPE